MTTYRVRYMNKDGMTFAQRFVSTVSFDRAVEYARSEAVILRLDPAKIVVDVAPNP